MENLLTVATEERIGETGEHGARFNERLLPELPDQITLAHVVPKLPWSACCILSKISRGWRQAVKSGQVSDARIRFNSKETLAVMLVNRVHMGLYSMRDKLFYRLPHFPSGRRGSCQCVILNDKVYILGGDPSNGSTDMYVIDLVWQKGWEQRASMLYLRGGSGIGSAAKDGKIYVLGGAYGVRTKFEVYDPEENRWSRITSKQLSSRTCEVVNLGERLLVHGRGRGITQVYHPTKDEWKWILDAGEEFSKTLFTVPGKLYVITAKEIAVYNEDENTWSHLHWNSFDVLEPGEIKPYRACADNDFILLLAHWTGNSGEVLSCVLRSQGLGSDVETIMWEKEENFPQCLLGKEVESSEWLEMIGFTQL